MSFEGTQTRGSGMELRFHDAHDIKNTHPDITDERDITVYFGYGIC